MKVSALCAALLLLVPCVAATAADDQTPDQAHGSTAIALAALVAEHSPLLSTPDKATMAKLLAGQSNFPLPSKNKITVQATALTCRESNVAILARSCELVFGAKKVELSGRQAHELYATIFEAGVPGDGAVGSVFETMSSVKCIIDPTGTFQNDGGGADCTFKPGNS